MTNHPNRSRIWQIDSVVYLRDESDWHGEVIREFWVPASGGYVREIDDAHPGTLGRQVCRSLHHEGHTLHSSPEGLKALILAEYRRRQRTERKEAAI